MNQLVLAAALLFAACFVAFNGLSVLAGVPSKDLPAVGLNPKLPPPVPGFDVENYPTVVGWPAGSTPKAPAGFAVTRFAGDLSHPRWLYVLPNGDVLVAEAKTKPKPPKNQEEKQKQEKQQKADSLGPSADRITLLRDSDGDGVSETRHTFAEGLNQPFGMLLLGDRFYIANTDAVLQFDFPKGQARLTGAGKKILDLPAGGYNNHWTRNLLANRAGTKIYVTVGSASNNGEYGLDEEIRRANILEINPDGTGERIYASGLRNPNGMDWHPKTGALWTVVNERDNLGDNLVPDYLTSVKEGGFYGWPFSYWGKHNDPTVNKQRPDLVSQAIVPDFALGSHTAALGLVFYSANAFPAHYRNGAFIGQHGSWNRTEFSGYKVVFVPFDQGSPKGPMEDFLTGFMADQQSGRTYGRPVGVVVDRAGALLVADDAGNAVWRVTAVR